MELRALRGSGCGVAEISKRFGKLLKKLRGLRNDLNFYAFRRTFEAIAQDVDWHWFSHDEGKNYTFTKTLASLEPHRADISIVQGLSHPRGRKLVSRIAATSSRC